MNRRLLFSIGGAYLRWFPHAAGSALVDWFTALEVTARSVTGCRRSGAASWAYWEDHHLAVT